MRALEFVRDHVIFKLPYGFSYQMKTPNLEHDWSGWAGHGSKEKFCFEYSQVSIKRAKMLNSTEFFMRFVDKKLCILMLTRISENQTSNLLLATTQILILSVKERRFLSTNCM